MDMYIFIILSACILGRSPFESPERHHLILICYKCVTTVVGYLQAC